jgi:hypothetical protein
MESIVAWAGEAGRRLEPYGLEISDKLAELALERDFHNGGIGSSSATLCYGIRLLVSTSSEQSLFMYQALDVLSTLNDSLNMW